MDERFIVYATVRPEIGLEAGDVSKDKKVKLPVEDLSSITGDLPYLVVDTEQAWLNKHIYRGISLAYLNEWLLKASKLDFMKLLCVLEVQSYVSDDVIDYYNSFIFFDGIEETNSWHMEGYEKAARWLVENASKLSKQTGLPISTFTFDGINPVTIPKKLLDYIDWEGVWNWFECSGFSYAQDQSGNVTMLWKE